MHEGIKVIVLLRDPRGTYMSRYPYIRKETRKRNIKNYCDMMASDWKRVVSLFSEYGNTISKVLHYIRYEDMASQPIDSMNLLYNFLGFNFQGGTGRRCISMCNDG